MQAIGMIETKGLLASIEAADAMVKSANVNILEKVYVGGGYVSITITGDIGAVKSAVDAGVSAVNKLNENSLVSHHVIARPHYDLERIIETIPAIEKIEKDSEEVTVNEIVSEYSDENNENKESLNNKTLVNIVQESVNEVLENVTTEELESDSLGCEELDDDLDKEEMDKLVEEKGLEESLELINRLKISKIRKLVKEYKEFELTNKTISKMDKTTLIIKLREYYTSK